tara:strand:- start:4994 stop:5368 length:375 start_codon:yes stop_codon:yes gene_type:complete
MIRWDARGTGQGVVVELDCGAQEAWKAVPFFLSQFRVGGILGGRGWDGRIEQENQCMRGETQAIGSCLEVLILKFEERLMEPVANLTDRPFESLLDLLEGLWGLGFLEVVRSSTEGGTPESQGE